MSFLPEFLRSDPIPSFERTVERGRLGVPKQIPDLADGEAVVLQVVRRGLAPCGIEKLVIARARGRQAALERSSGGCESARNALNLCLALWDQRHDQTANLSRQIILYRNAGKYFLGVMFNSSQHGIAPPHGNLPVIAGEGETVACVLAPDRAAKNFLHFECVFRLMNKADVSRTQLLAGLLTQMENGK